MNETQPALTVLSLSAAQVDQIVGALVGRTATSEEALLTDSLVGYITRQRLAPPPLVAAKAPTRAPKQVRKTRAAKIVVPEHTPAGSGASALG